MNPIDTHPTNRSMLADLRAGFAQSNLWRYLAKREIARQYDRTAIGPFWIPINILIHVAVLGVVFSAVLDSPKGYLSYFAISYSIWTTISRTLNEASNLWTSSSKYLTQFSTPISMFLAKAIYKLALIFAMSLPVGIAIAIAFGTRPTLSTLLVIPGLLIYFANIFWILTVLSIAALRFRDIAKFMPNLLFLIYLSTPILWSIDRLGDDHQWIAIINPVYHLISLIREPLLGSSPSTLTWTLCISAAIVGNIVALWTLKTFRWRIPLWL